MQEGLHGAIRLGDLVRQADDGVIERPDGSPGEPTSLSVPNAAAASVKHIGDHGADDLADPDMNEAGAVDLPRCAACTAAKGRPDKRQFAQIAQIEQPGPQAIVDIVAVIGDIVRNRGDLRLRRGKGVEFEVVVRHVFDDGGG